MKKIFICALAVITAAAAFIGSADAAPIKMKLAYVVETVNTHSCRKVLCRTLKNILMDRSL